MDKFQARKRTQKTANHCLDNKKYRGSQKRELNVGREGSSRAETACWFSLPHQPFRYIMFACSYTFSLSRLFFINTVNPSLNSSFTLHCTFCLYSFLFLLPFLFLSLLLSVSGSHWPIPHNISTPFHFSTVPFNSLDHLNPQHVAPSLWTLPSYPSGTLLTHLLLLSEFPLLLSITLLLSNRCQGVAPPRTIQPETASRLAALIPVRVNQLQSTYTDLSQVHHLSLIL